MYCFSPRWGRGWISLRCKYTQCGPYQVLLLYMHPDLCLTPHHFSLKAYFKVSVPPYLLKGYFFIASEHKSSKERERRSCRAHGFCHPTVEKPRLILSGIVGLHSTTNAPFTVVTPNNAYQTSHTLRKNKQYAKEKLLSPHVKSWILPADFWLHLTRAACTVNVAPPSALET